MTIIRNNFLQGWNYSAGWRRIQDLAAWFRPAADGVALLLEREVFYLLGLRQRWRGLEVSQVASFPRPAGGWEELQPEFDRYIKNQHLEDCPAGIVVAETLSFCRLVSLPAPAADDLPQVLAYEMDRFLPLEASQLYYTYEICARTADTVSFLLLAVSREVVEPALSLWRAAGLKLISLEPVITATSTAFAWLGGPLPRTWWLLQATDNQRVCYLLEAGRLASQRRFSAAELAGQLPELLHIEAPKVKEGAVGEPVTVGILGKLTPAEYQALRSQAERFNLIEADRLTLEGELLPQLPEAVRPPLLGAARRVMGRPYWRGNLLAPKERDAIHFVNRSWSRILLLSLLVLLVIWAASDLILTGLALRRIQGQVAALEPQVSRIKQDLAELQRLNQAVRELSGSEERKIKKIDLLKNLTEIIPTHTWIYNLRLGSKVMELSGYSRSASDLIQTLEKSGLFAKTEFSSPITADAKGNENFTLRTELKTVD